jgi:hypothetical protein
LDWCQVEQIKEDKTDWAYRTYGRDLKSLHNVVRKPERKRPLKRLSRRWKIIIKLIFKIEGWMA